MSDLVIYDTSVLVDQVRTGRHSERIASVEGRIRLSAVVLAELKRGMKGTAERRFVEAMARNQAIFTPTEKNWADSGEILACMQEDHGFAPAKLRDLHFDLLIALTARTHGARLITTNRKDFELINRYRKIKLEVW
jgi:predicted nucleic acid-binding protein